MVVTGSDLFSNTWKTVYHIVSGNLTAGKIYSAFPEVGSAPFSTQLPMVIIENPEASQSTITHGFGMINSDMTIPIDIYSSNRANLDQVSDEVQYGFVSGDRATLAASGLKLMGISPAGQGTDLGAGNVKRLHYKTLNVGLNFVE